MIFEADYPEKCDYDKIVKELLNNNCKIVSGHQNVYINTESYQVLKLLVVF